MGEFSLILFACVGGDASLGKRFRPIATFYVFCNSSYESYLHFANVGTGSFSRILFRPRGNMSSDYVKIARLNDVHALRERLEELDLELPVDNEALTASAGSPLAQPIEVDGVTVGNRWCIHPMEGWDANRDGSPTEYTLRRWRNFGLSGAKLIWGGEAAAVQPDGRLAAFRGDTRLFCTPGFRFQAVDQLFTNFHLPRSTLFMLVCAFAGTEHMRAAYRHAIDKEYRFFSYGDATLLKRA